VPANQSEGEQTGHSVVVYVEDGLIILSIGFLFWLGVFHRAEAWAQGVLVLVLIMMAVVFVARVRRVQRALRKREDWPEDFKEE
jgi:hypothetical protein